MGELEPLESQLLRLNAIVLKCSTILREFQLRSDVGLSSGSDAADTTIREFQLRSDVGLSSGSDMADTYATLLEAERWIEADREARYARALLYENMMLQAWHFIKVRKAMCRDPRLAKIDRIASPLVQMAIDYEHAIFEMRNNYLAHMQEKGDFRKTGQDIAAEYGMPLDDASGILLMKGIRAYGNFVTGIFIKEFVAASHKYSDRPPAKNVPTGISMDKVDEIFRQRRDAVVSGLKRAGLISAGRNDASQSMKDS